MYVPPAAGNSRVVPYYYYSTQEEVGNTYHGRVGTSQSTSRVCAVTYLRQQIKTKPESENLSFFRRIIDVRRRWPPHHSLFQENAQLQAANKGFESKGIIQFYRSCILTKIFQRPQQAMLCSH